MKKQEDEHKEIVYNLERKAVLDKERCVRLEGNPFVIGATMPRTAGYLTCQVPHPSYLPLLLSFPGKRREK